MSDWRGYRGVDIRLMPSFRFFAPSPTFLLSCVYVRMFHSGFVYQFIRIVLAAMVAGCWASSKSEPLIKFFIFVELSASNMLAVTNLAICVNLALVVKVKFPHLSTGAHSLKHDTLVQTAEPVQGTATESFSPEKRAHRSDRDFTRARV